VAQSYVRRFFEVMPDLVSAQPKIIYVDTPHEGFDPWARSSLVSREPARKPQAGCAPQAGANQD